jgi:hypothetical protein
MTSPRTLIHVALVAMTISVAACAHATQTGELSLHQENVRMPDDPDAFDREMVRQLGAAGSDVTKPARVLYSLYIPSRRDAETVARQLRSAGYGASVQAPVGKLPDGRPETRTWLVASNRAVPSLDHARLARRYFDALARRYHGEYSGWGANVVK